jgi:methionyl-tRNA synthetase
MPQLLVHGWWNLAGAKMSKSAGNIIDPFVLADKYGTDALRYYLMSDILTGKDADFSEERLIERYNASLANGIGNLLSRTLNMVHKYLGGRLKRVEPKEKSLIESWFFTNVNVYREAFDGGQHVAANGQCVVFPAFQISAALETVMVGGSVADHVIEHSAPWKLAKDSSKAAELANVLYDSTEAMRILAILISPVLPHGAHGIFDQLSWKMELSGKEERFSLADAEWGRLPDGHVVGKPVPLFPRIEIDERV